MISKLRTFTAMMGGLQSKEQKELLKYTKDRIINLEEKSSSEYWTDSTSEEEQEEEDLPKVKKDKYSNDIDHAVVYSIIKNIGLDA